MKMKIMLSIGLLVFLCTDVRGAQFVRRVLWSKTGAVAGVLAGYQGWLTYDINKKLRDACEASSSSLSEELQNVVREIFRSHGVNTVRIVDAEEVMERVGENFPKEFNTLSAISFPKNIVIIPPVERLILDEGVARILNPYTGKSTIFYREGTEAGLHHEAAHCKHKDDVEKIGHCVLQSPSLALLVGRAVYLKVGGGKKLVTIGMGSLAAIATHVAAEYATAFRNHQIEKRCDLSIPSSTLMRFYADDMEKEDSLLEEMGAKKEETFLDVHPLTEDRVAYMQEAADRLEREGK